jgi:hypothetical protein
LFAFPIERSIFHGRELGNGLSSHDYRFSIIHRRQRKSERIFHFDIHQFGRGQS